MEIGIKKRRKLFKAMVVLEGSQMAATTLGGPYAQGAPALKLVQKRFLGLHQWLSPVYSKEIKEQLVSVN